MSGVPVNDPLQTRAKSDFRGEPETTGPVLKSSLENVDWQKFYQAVKGFL